MQQAIAILHALLAMKFCEVLELYKYLDTTFAESKIDSLEVNAVPVFACSYLLDSLHINIALGLNQTTNVEVLQTCQLQLAEFKVSSTESLDTTSMVCKDYCMLLS